MAWKLALERYSPLHYVSDASEGRVLPALMRINRRSPESAESEKRKHFAQSPAFNAFIGVLIISNTFTLGIELDYSRGTKVSERLAYFIMDTFFLCGFVLELFARLNHLGWDYFLDAWNVFDFYVVCVTMAELMVAAAGEASGALKMASAVRIVRLLRIVRSLQGLRVFYGLWLIVTGFLDALRTQLWVVMLLVLIAYCGAVVLTTMVGQDGSVTEYWVDAPRFFGTVPVSMWSILQFGTFDRWCTDIMRPLLQVNTVSGVLMFFLLVVLGLGITNVMIAVMVESALSNARESVDSSQDIVSGMDNILLSKMAKDFHEVDEDGSGDLDRDEFNNLLKLDKVAYKFRLLGINMDEADELFEVIDCDGSGTITADEYVLGLSKLRGQTRGQDVVALISFAHMQCLTASRCLLRLRRLNTKADLVVQRLNGVGKLMSEELHDRGIQEQRTKDMWLTTAERAVILNKLEEEKRTWFPPMC
eukprot:TRINITY_DN45339_c0_g1_i1.p1 TRINITY_DN45339_c0_g1~~TRINITY_DN45339_c0_g1_i1.p1  ORF type:complete len:476 (+),score=104.66 TRINITY_DN45339_c0_g1_i1:129-1556(+)